MQVGYTGERNAAGEPHGHGRKVFDDGGVYDGHWVDGVEEGEGAFTWTWGDQYAPPAYV